jgi:hypothetical protein
VLYIGLEDFPLVELSTTIKPIPSQPTLAKRVVFLPLFLGTLKNVGLPRGE